MRQLALKWKTDSSKLLHHHPRSCLRNCTLLLPEDVEDNLGQGSVLFNTVDLRRFASDVHFAFSLCHLVFLESSFQLSHFASHVCNGRKKVFIINRENIQYVVVVLLDQKRNEDVYFIRNNYKGKCLDYNK